MGRRSGIIFSVRIYLIDGYSLLYRAFYALPQSISTSSGLPTNALYGFTSMLLKLLDTEEEVGLGVVWDGGMPEFRLKIFPEYKAQRSAMPEELRSQVDHMDEILDAMNVPAITAEGFEADDALATMSRQVPDDDELYIVTGDQDAMQLVDGRVKVLRTTRGVSETKTYGRDEVVEEYGVTPEQIPDYKALTGDSSDNIPGVRGIGPKGAANLLEQFGTLDGVYENLENISAKGTRKKLEDGRESAFMSLDLARMRFDVPVKFDPESLRFEGVSPTSGTSPGATSSAPWSRGSPSCPSPGERSSRPSNGWRCASPTSPSSCPSSPSPRPRSSTTVGAGASPSRRTRCASRKACRKCP